MINQELCDEIQKLQNENEILKCEIILLSSQKILSYKEASILWRDMGEEIYNSIECTFCRIPFSEKTKNLLKLDINGILVRYMKKLYK